MPAGRADWVFFFLILFSYLFFRPGMEGGIEGGRKASGTRVPRAAVISKKCASDLFDHRPRARALAVI